MGSGKQFSREPVEVPPVKTVNREIKTKLPVPESLEILAALEDREPASMQGQPPVVWDRAEGFNIYDPWGNKWIDWSCGVLITSAGHGRPEIREAVKKLIDKPLLATYCFPNLERRRLVDKLIEVAPDGIDKAFILTTGSETCECVIKLARTRGLTIAPEKKVFVTFEGDFHGRTLGSQLAGGLPGLKDWCSDLGATFVQVPWPGSFRLKDTSFGLFEKSLEEQNIAPDTVCGVMCETYQGGEASFAPEEYMRDLAAWCRQHDALLIYDEVQAGFCRTGKFWGFEHYGTHVDLICCGKGISSSLPVSAVLGSSEVMNQYGPGSMTSTHAAAPLGCAAAYANIDVMVRENLADTAASGGAVLMAGLKRIQDAYPEHIGAVNGKGMVAALCMVKPGTDDSDPDTAHTVVEKCFQKGLLMFSPVGPGGGSIKISPPVNMPEDVINEAVGILEEAVSETLG